MARSFSLVDQKVAEAEFFLQRISDSARDFFAFRCHVSAFASSARSITFSLKSVLSGIDCFDAWYTEREKRLRDDRLARFFHEFRRVSQHIGVNPVGGSTGGPSSKRLYFFMPAPDLLEVPDDDVETACRDYFRTLIGIVYECYLEFGPVIDGQQYFTEENFERLGKTFEDAIEELGFPRDWADACQVLPESDRWKVLRRQADGCEINGLFEEYLGKTVPHPDSNTESHS
jgi:hypothetical protein